MEIKDFIEKFAETIEVEDSSVLTVETKFRELMEFIVSYASHCIL